MQPAGLLLANLGPACEALLDQFESALKSLGVDVPKAVYDALDRDCDGYIEDRDRAYARIRELEAMLNEQQEHLGVVRADNLRLVNRIRELEAAMVEVRAKLAIYLERLMRGDGVLPNRWVGEINDIVHHALDRGGEHG